MIQPPARNGSGISLSSVIEEDGGAAAATVGYPSNPPMSIVGAAASNTSNMIIASSSSAVPSSSSADVVSVGIYVYGLPTWVKMPELLTLFAEFGSVVNGKFDDVKIISSTFFSHLLPTFYSSWYHEQGRSRLRLH